MIRRLVALWQSDHMTIVLNGLLIGAALKAIHEVVERRTDELAQINTELAARRAELAALEAPLSPAPAGSYPAREDLDPLAAAGEDDRG